MKAERAKPPSKTVARKRHNGEVAEWSKALVSKTSIPQGIESSNLSLSAWHYVIQADFGPSLRRFLGTPLWPYPNF